MGKRRTIGTNPLDAVVPAGEDEKPRRVTTAPEKPALEEKDRLAVYLPLGLIERLKNAVYWTPGATVSSLVEEVLKEGLDHLEKKRGEPFPQRTGEVKRGRPTS